MTERVVPQSAASRRVRAASLLALLAAAVAPAACGRPAATQAAAESTPIGGPFELVDTTGAPFTDKDLLGKPFLVYFGFTYCPDVCPLTLVKVAQALDSLGEDAARFRTVLITVDPERDTPEQLAQYVRNNGFPKNLIGLTGTPEQVRAVADAYRVYYKKVDSPETTAPYLMEHTSVLYLMDAQGRFAGVFTHASTPDEIAAGLRRLLAAG